MILPFFLPTDLMEDMLTTLQLEQSRSTMNRNQELLDRLQVYKFKGLISIQKHPYYNLWIHNYTPKAQYERVWDETTTMCRGLILDANGHIVSRPFPKFFNLDELSSSDIVFSKPFRAYDKMDGSLGILYETPDGQRMYRHAVATRGSFDSAQARWATQYYQQNYSQIYDPPKGVTLLFEIIYPANRIVVDYRGMQGLWLLAAIDNETGRDVEIDNWPGPRADSVDVDPGTKPRDVLASLDLVDDGNTEGLVLVFDWPKEGPNRRVKIKMEEYKRLHRVITGVSTKTVWEYLATGNNINEILDNVPDEFYSWVRKTAQELSDRHAEEYAFHVKEFKMVLDYLWPQFEGEEQHEQALGNRKEFAMGVKEMFVNQKMAFALLDRKDINPMIWADLKPEYSRPFADDGDIEEPLNEFT